MKHKVMNATLNATAVGGKAVFIDYYRPAWWSPLNAYLLLKYAIFERNGFDLFKHQLEDYADKDLHSQFEWKGPETSFGKMFQKVVATRKSLND